MKDKPIRSILDQSFNYALQDIVEPNAVSMIPKQHLDQAEQAIIELIKSKKPNKYVYKNDEGHLYHQGWNEAIDDYDKRLGEL